MKSARVGSGRVLQWRRQMNRRERAATLAEVLVAVAVLAIGLLGLAGLQTVALHESRTLQLRSEALLAVIDLLERMQANPGAEYGPLGPGAPPAAPPANCATNSCSPAELALHDIAGWQCAVNSGAGDGSPVCAELGIRGFGGLGSIIREAELVRVRIEWPDGRTGGIELQVRD